MAFQHDCVHPVFRTASLRQKDCRRSVQLCRKDGISCCKVVTMQSEMAPSRLEELIIDIQANAKPQNLLEVQLNNMYRKESIPQTRRPQHSRCHLL